MNCRNDVVAAMGSGRHGDVVVAPVTQAAFLSELRAPREHVTRRDTRLNRGSP